MMMHLKKKEIIKFLLCLCFLLTVPYVKSVGIMQYSDILSVNIDYQCKCMKKFVTSPTKLWFLIYFPLSPKYHHLLGRFFTSIFFTAPSRASQSQITTQTPGRGKYAKACSTDIVVREKFNYIFHQSWCRRLIDSKYSILHEFHDKIHLG